ncbi:Phosphoribosyltransferase (fragment) [Cupriavidus taiwanensis]
MGAQPGWLLRSRPPGRLQGLRQCAARAGCVRAASGRGEGAGYAASGLSAPGAGRRAGMGDVLLGAFHGAYSAARATSYSAGTGARPCAA